jgi:predicted nucleotidyltransferase
MFEFGGEARRSFLWYGFRAMSRAEILARLAALKPWLASEGVTRLRLFGSHARDQARADSDIDLIADFSRPLGLRQFTLQDEVSARLGQKVELVTERALAPDIRLTALRDAIDA